MWYAMRPMLRTFRHATFRGGISHVIETSAKKQMVRTNANFHVTSMTNIDTIWNLSIRQHVGNTMCLIHRAIEPHAPITAVGKSAAPQPACRSFFNFRPETIISRCNRTREARKSHAWTRTITNGMRRHARHQLAALIAWLGQFRLANTCRVMDIERIAHGQSLHQVIDLANHKAGMWCACY
jgi:hypothetical protein